jgi:hypothetical protein
MTAIVVNYLRDKFSNHDDVGIGFIYCSYGMQEEQTKEKLMAGFLRQLIKPEYFESDKVQTLYEQCKEAGRRPSFSELSNMLHDVTQTYSATYVIVDALDECGPEWPLLISGFQHMQSLLTALRIMVTFRPHVDVAEKFADFVPFDIRARSWDLKQYVMGQLSLLSKHVKENSSLREEVIEGIANAADGM